MRISFNKYPMDIFLCILWSFILIPIVLLDVEGILRIVIGLPFVFFVPGYILIFAFFPSRKTDRGIDSAERIILSIGMSMTMSLIGLGLNYMPWGITLFPYLTSVIIFIIFVGSIGIYRWFKIDSDTRFIISVDLSSLKSENKFDRVLTVILTISIILAVAAFTYVIITPKTGEKFTEFYILGPEGNAINYPKNLTSGENATITIGLVNHECRTIDYTIEIWLINQTIIQNVTTNGNMTLYNHVWFMDKINITLDHKSINVEGPWKPQWEYNYTFNISEKGKDFKLVFLLFTASTADYSHGEDYKDIIEKKISSAYRELHLWINVD